MVEHLRNILLCLAQLSWSLTDLGNQVSSTTCQILGSIVHLLWMLFWFSTGIEALLLYHAINNIIRRNGLFYRVLVLGLAVPVVLVIILLTHSFLTHSQTYLRKQGNDVICFLGSSTNWPIYSLLVPVTCILLFNLTVSILAVKAAYVSATFR